MMTDEPITEDVGGEDDDPDAETVVITLDVHDSYIGAE